MRTIALAFVILLSSTVIAHADPATAIPAAQDWWDLALNSAEIKVTKKAPVNYGVFPYAAEACGVYEDKRVDKVTNSKGFSALTSCLSEASAAKENAEYTWEPSDVDMLLIGFDYDKKLAKKIKKQTKKLEIVSLEISGSENAADVHVFFALDKKGNVKGVYMYVDSAN